MINSLYKFVQTVANNELDGNISPTDFDLITNNSVEELYDEDLEQLKRLIDREKRSGKNISLDSITDKYYEKILHYHYGAEAIYADGKYNLPDDLRYLDTIEHSGNEVEIIKRRREFKAILNLADTNPSAAMPVGYVLDKKVEIAPSTIQSPIAIYYLRSPKKCKWTFSMAGRTPLFNPDAQDFQDVDIHPSQQYTLSVRILQKLGVNLKDDQLAQYGLSKESNEFNKENSN